MKPKIGILLDYQKSGSFSSRPHYAIRVNYLEIIYKAGGFPVAIPYIDDALDDYLNMIDGIVLPGGFYPFEPSWYTDGKSEESDDNSRRDADIRTAKKVFEKNIPVLGICAGMQVIAGIHGCKFAHNTKDIADPKVKPILHIDIPAEEKAHSVETVPGSLLHKITGLNKFDVNSCHHEATATITDKVKVTAKAPDGIIEAIEIPSAKFALGVQWHPEFFDKENDPDFKIFKQLIKVASEK